MFFEMKLQHLMKLHPRHFGKELIKTLILEFRKEVEGNCAVHIGCVMCVTRIISIGPGYLQRFEGCALHTITYEALMFRPIRGEVIDVFVTHVTKLGIFAKMGPVNCFISQYSVPSHYEFCTSTAPPCFKSKNNSSNIAATDKIRVRILGIRTQLKSIFMTASLLEDYLGVVRH